jgi:hypothetical protein
MSGPEPGHALRLGGLIFAGAALLAAGAAGLQWSMAPALLRNVVIELVFIIAGTFLLVIGLVSLALERRAWVASRPVPSAAPSPRSSLMTLPAMVGGGSAPVMRSTSPEPVLTPPTPSPSSSAAPVALAAEGPSNSTLLIPFANELPSVGPAPPLPVADQTVSSLMGRMDTLQRAIPSNPGVPAGAPAGPEPGPIASPLLLRLTRIPTPPAHHSTPLVARRCTDCGEAFGSPPQFEPCADCGRALCERCYWRTSSGPQAHLCRSCFEDRSVPRPPAPGPTFVRPGPNVLISTPSGRAVQPRRPVS